MVLEPNYLQNSMEFKSSTDLIFIPFPGRGHLLAHLEMAKLLVSRDHRLTVTVLVIRPFYDPKSVAHSYAHHNSPESNSRIRFIDISSPDATLVSPTGTKSLPSHLNYIEYHKDRVKKEISRRIQEGRVAGLVVDMFCASMINVANEFRVPTYLFFTVSASVLGLMFHYQMLRDYEHQDLTVYKDMLDETVLVPSCKLPFPLKLSPEGMLERDGGIPKLLDSMKMIREAKGIMINTFQELETHAIESLVKDPKIPPIYPVGPILSTGDEKDSGDTMKWLDAQPDSSVVYLCFGSKGTFEETQLRVIATALERSGHRFLWSLRKPPVTEKSQETPGEYEDPNEVLPQGFMERTKEIGKVIGWAPQMAVLSHPAVGGFVSHCGWNSTLESLWCGVPMAVWPLFGEQHANAFALVMDLRVAVDIKMDYDKINNNPMVTEEEIEKGIRQLMEHGSEVRDNMEALKAKSRIAGLESGSSFKSVDRFIMNVIMNRVRDEING